MISAVFGGLFGDEGKGRVTNLLSSSKHSPTIVVRFSGGAQAGHHVLYEGKEHIFSHFGSGTLQGVPTFWSKYCPVDPVAFINELTVLENKGISPRFYADVKCPLVTIFDIIHNRDKAKSHGTCGKGISATWEREENHYSLLLGDLFYDSIFKIKLDNIAEYYRLKGVWVPDGILEGYVAHCRNLLNFIMPINNHKELLDYKSNIIFEGSQGLLLDQNIGFFPNVTRSNTGTKNILDMGYEPDEICIVIRAFQTRHGIGPMTNTDIHHYIKDNTREINVSNEWQGEFRRSLLDLDLLEYGMGRDEFIRNNPEKVKLYITCMDLIETDYRFTHSNKIFTFKDEKSFIDGIKNSFSFDVDIHTLRYYS